MKNWFKTLIAASVVVGVLVASMALYAAWEHNPQEAFHGAGGVDWVSLAWIGIAWFGLSAVAVLALLVAGRWVLTRGDPGR